MPSIRGRRSTFLHLLVSTLLVSLTNFTVWFAITFYVYIETRSVFATGVISGIFLVMTALTGIWFGSLVDHYAKKTVMQVSALVSAVLYAAAFLVYLTAPRAEFSRPASVVLWSFVVLLMIGVIAGNVRTIALPTLVTLLIEEPDRDRANGLVGTTAGVSFLVTSVISGGLVALGDMFWVLILALVVLPASILHLAAVRVDESRLPSPPAADPTAATLEPGALAPGAVSSEAGVAGPVSSRVVGASAEPVAAGAVAPGAAAPGAGLGVAAGPVGEVVPPPKRSVDLKGTIRLVRQVPGLTALIAFSAFNNLLGGVFMALLDAYGLSMMSVQAWGLLWGLLSTGFIVGGLLVARTGLGRSPLRLLLLINIVLWTVTLLFPLRNSIILLTIGLYVYMVLSPYAEAAEQTILQRVVPYERQGRVFGFAQSVEQAASPLTAFLIAPVAQFVFIPFMTDGFGARTIGSWFGTGADRGLALVFVLTGVVGLIATSAALRSRPYRRLNVRYAETPAA